MLTQKIFLVALSLILVPSKAPARDFKDINIEILSDKRGGEAKQEAFDQAIEQATKTLTDELLGPEKAAKLWGGAKAKLLKNSTRYLVFIKGSPPLDEGGKTKTTVFLRLSPDNLETLLREEGLLSSGTLKVLPLLEVVDSHGAHFAWWASPSEEGKPTPLEDLFKRFYGQMAGKFKAKGAFVLDPTGAAFRMTVPAAYRSNVLRREDQMLLAQYLKADIVISGRVESVRPRNENSELRLSYELQMWQAKSGRTIGEVQRSEPLSSEAPKVVLATLEQSNPKVMEELATKLNEAVTSGGLSLNLIRMAVTGVMSYRQQNEFRRQLAQLRDIRVLKERSFEPNRIVFEAETTVTGQELARTLQKTKFSLYTVEVDGAQDDSLALSVKALSSSSAQ